MGHMRFHVPHRERLPPDSLQCAYISGIEGIPSMVAASWHKHDLVLRRDMNESGNLFIPWVVRGVGELMLSTTSLMEREAPYNLTIELARGTVNRLRNFAADWEAAGMQLPDAVGRSLREAVQAFIQAASAQRDAGSHAAAEQAIVHGCVGIEALGEEFSRHMIYLRTRTDPRLPTMVACRLHPFPQPPAVLEGVQRAFNSVVIPLSWRAIEKNAGDFCWDSVDQPLQWARASGLRVCAGPLLQLDAARVPEWLYLWEDDFEDLRASAMRYVEAAVRRYNDHVQVWNCAARLNLKGALNLTEEQKLRLAVDAVQTIRKIDSRKPVTITFDQPWSEYMAREDHDFAPLNFADAMVRADLGLTGIGLEFNLGYWPGGTRWRDWLDINRQIDRWSLLGLPLLVHMTLPSAQTTDPQATSSARVIATEGEAPITPESQRRQMERLVRLLLAKPVVHGLVWSQLSDAWPHELPHGGLFDPQQRPKPALDALIAMRVQHLK